MGSEGAREGCGMESIPVCLGHVPSIMSNIKISLSREKSRKQGPFGLCGVKWLAADHRPGRVPLAHLLGLELSGAGLAF